MKRVRKVVFPVAGLGTRMLPATKVVPKELLPVVDKPIIQYAVEEAAAAGAEQFIFVTGRGKTLIEDHFDRATELFEALDAKGKDKQKSELEAQLYRPGEVVYTRQQQPLGLGHAVWCARHIVGDEPFGVILPDDLIDGPVGCMQQLIDAHEKTGGNIIAALEVAREHTSRYGIIEPGEDDGELVAVKRLVEKPDPQEAPSQLAVIGRYVLTPEVFAELDRHTVGAGGEIQLTDAMERLIGVQPFHGCRFNGRRFDCGDRLGYLEANLALSLARPETADEMQDLVARHARVER